jgi:hypothetical protein
MNSKIGDDIDNMNAIKFHDQMQESSGKFGESLVRTDSETISKSFQRESGVSFLASQASQNYEPRRPGEVLCCALWLQISRITLCLEHHDE